MRVALYARVSTLNGQHPEMQLSELREYGARRGWQIISEYVDEGVSGSRERRPQLDRLMADAHRRKFDLIAVWKIDRFGRSLKHLVNALADLDSLGVAFVSLKDNLDLGTPSGDYSQTNTCGTSVAAKAKCTVSVTFTPTATGTRSAAVTITDNTSNSPQNVTLTGSGIMQATVSPASLSFGSVAVGSITSHRMASPERPRRSTPTP